MVERKRTSATGGSAPPRSPPPTMRRNWPRSPTTFAVYKRWHG